MDGQDRNDWEDQPEGEGMSLVVPFVVCESHGGPYEDQSFVAGFQAGEVDKALSVAEAVGTTVVKWPVCVRSDLVKQLELIAMNRHFPVIQADTIDGQPEWSTITFAVSATDLP